MKYPKFYIFRSITVAKTARHTQLNSPLPPRHVVMWQPDSAFFVYKDKENNDATPRPTSPLKRRWLSPAECSSYYSPQEKQQKQSINVSVSNTMTNNQERVLRHEVRDNRDLALFLCPTTPPLSSPSRLTQRVVPTTQSHESPSPTLVHHVIRPQTNRRPLQDLTASLTPVAPPAEVR